MKKKLILVNGKKRHGKDYFAECINKNINNVEILSFAEPMKFIIAKTFGISLDVLDDYKNDKEPIYVKQGNEFVQITDFRDVLKHFANEGMKPTFGKNVWAELLRQKVEKSTAEYIIIPDFRFEVELQALMEFNPYLIQVFNDDIPNNDLHSSETELDDIGLKFDVRIDNTGRPDNFEERAVETFNNLINSAPYILNEHYTNISKKAVKKIDTLSKENQQINKGRNFK